MRTVHKSVRLDAFIVDEAKSISQAISDSISNMSLDIDVYQVGKVISVSDGICHISGLSDAMYGETVEFDNGVFGMVLDLEKDHIGCIIFGSFESVEAGDPVRRSGHVMKVPVGEALLGRVVDALGKPIDGIGVIIPDEYRPIECQAPSIPDRKSVSVPLQTGIKAIDALVPIGRGQRELIIGDRQTGKTSIAMDTIINQKGKDVICIYVAIGQKETTVAQIQDTFTKCGAMEYTTIVCADAYHSAPMQYVAPYAGSAMGEYFMYKGKDVLIVFDDLSKHAAAYREISLLLHRPSGREAYPGDVFYLHSRLLERSARLSPEAGGGSMTALPIIETQAGDISAYIPTNAISITDGQIFLESELFLEGQRPAVNVGLSVSRVGGAAQIGAMRQIAGRLRMDLAQYRELAAFSQFGSELDKATKDSIEKGKRMMALLNQPQFAPVPVERQVLAIYAVAEGYADDVNVEDISTFESELCSYFAAVYPGLLQQIATGGKMSQELMQQLKDAIAEFKENAA
jgi:F-type H+-transporting ATPase subunit alpha